MTFNRRSDKLTTIIKQKINYKEALMMENRVSNSKANATYQNSSKVKEVAYRIFAAVANAIFGRSRRRTINPNNW